MHDCTTRAFAEYPLQRQGSTGDDLHVPLRLNALSQRGRKHIPPLWQSGISFAISRQAA